MTNLCIYHADCVDGFGAAWAAYYFAQDPRNMTFLPYTYGKPAPLDLCRGLDVTIVDFSFPRDQLEALHSVARSLLVLDHHATAEADLRGLPYCIFDMNRSGAGITWDALSGGQPRHWLIDYIEDRDLWRFKLEHSREVNAYLRSIPQDFRTWDDLATKSVSEVAALGAGCLAHIDAYVRAAMKHCFQAVIDNVTLPLVNVTYESCSEVANEMVKRYDAPIAGYFFTRGDGTTQYGLRSKPGVDCTPLARKFGGGGHPNAAGFTTNLPVHTHLFPLS